MIKRFSVNLAIIVLVLVGSLLFGAQKCYAADYIIEDSSFNLYNGAIRVADTSASDGYSAKMTNTSNWNIQYNNWDFSSLKAGTSYDVYVKVKVKHLVSNPTGNAFKIAAYDTTSGNYVMPAKTIAASDTQDMVWKEYKIGTFKPNLGVDKLCFYTEGSGNSSQISDIYVDCITFKEYIPYTIQDNEFRLFNGATRVTDPMSTDNSAARMVNGPGADWKIQALIDGTKIDPGKSYKVQMLVWPERADWYTSSGDMFGYMVYDCTTGSYLVNPTTVQSLNSNKLPYYMFKGTDPISINPSHDVRVIFYQVNNATQIPAFKVDYVSLVQVPEDDSFVSPITAYPYKISPANTDGLNDTTDITYTLPSSQTVYVRIYKDSDNSLVKTILNGAAQSGTNTVTWNGKNDSEQIVPNGLYYAKVSNTTGDLFKINIQVITGVTVTSTANTAKNHFPKGVFYEGGAIPYSISDARTYLDRTFNDIEALGADMVFVSNFHKKSAEVYTATLDKAAENNLKVIALPEGYTVYNEGLYNDEVAMYNYLNSLVDSYKTHSALFGYYLRDEPEYDIKLADNMKDMKRMLETIDPNHPVFTTYCGADRLELHHSIQKNQVMNIDPYGAGAGRPVGDFTNIFGYAGFSYETYMDFSSLQPRKDIVDEAPMWTILQLQGYGEQLREPTPEEVRAMTYEAIGHGSKGITYFLYQTECEMNGLVDPNLNHTIDYGTTQTLFSEIEILKPTIKNMRRINNTATTAGGGLTASGQVIYPSADITTHEDIITGDKYLVVVNHDCQNSQNVTITIDKAKLGMKISSIENVYNNSNISFTSNANSYIISNLSFAAGDGKILKLVKDSSEEVYVGQDSDFSMWNGATKGNLDVSTSDSSTTKETVTSQQSWNAQWYWNKANLVPGATYDLYAVVKIKYATDMYNDGGTLRLFSPSGNAINFGVWDCTTSSFVVPEQSVGASSFENMFWKTIKIGSFIPSQTNSQVVYIGAANNPNNVQTVYVDKFYFVKQ